MKMKAITIEMKVPAAIIEELAHIAHEARQEGLDLEPQDVLLEALERGIKWLRDLAEETRELS